MNFSSDIFTYFDKNWALLTALPIGGSIAFEEAEVTLLCKKLFRQQLDVKAMPKEIAEKLYSSDAPHDMYIGAVEEVLSNRARV